MGSEEKLILGLDTGTNSVGFCLIDQDNKIVKKSDKYLWGIRLFESNSSTCKDRRTFRNARRRNNRLKKRIYFLQQLFQDEIIKDTKDDLFFYRLKFSQFQKSDKNGILFNDIGYTDKDYYKKYPTIYHLRKHLMEEDEKDPRLLYLACAHIIKNRGNFTESKQDTQQDLSKDIDTKELIAQSFNNVLKEIGVSENYKFNKDDVDKLIEEIEKYADDKKAKDGLIKFLKLDSMNKNMNLKKDFIEKSCLPLLNGSEKEITGLITKNIKEKYNLNINDDCKTKMSFKDSDKYNDAKSELQVMLDDDDLNLINIIDSFFNLYCLIECYKILGESKNISELMVNRYTTFRRQLYGKVVDIEEKEKNGEIDKKKKEKEIREFQQELAEMSDDEVKKMHLEEIGLKNYVLRILDKKKFEKDGKLDKDSNYYRIFKTPKIKDKKSENNFSKYVGNLYIGKIREKKCTYTEFYDFLTKNIFEINYDDKKKKEFLKNYCETTDDNVRKEIIQSILENKFLRIIHNGGNTNFPKQFNENELYRILKRQQNNFDFLQDEKTIDKIMKIFNFVIPFDVGPIHSNISTYENKFENGKNLNKFSWAAIKDGTTGEITPYNFDSIIDTNKSREEFMHRLIGKCSYLLGEEALPKKSPLIEYLDVLNEINKMKVNGKLLNCNDKKELIKEFYLNPKQEVNTKELKNYLKTRPDILKIKSDEEVKLSYSNSAKEFKIEHQLSSYRRLKDILGLCDDYDKRYIENGYIDLLEKIVENITIYGENKDGLENSLKKLLPNENADVIKKLKGLNFKKFSRLSKKLLINIVCDEESIIKHIINTNDNLQQTVTKSEFKEQINRENGEEFIINNDKDLMAFLEDKYVPNNARTPVIQAYKIVEELEKIVGENKIKEIYIETTRELTSNSKKGKVPPSRKEEIDKLYNDLKESKKSQNENYKDDINRVNKEKADKTNIDFQYSKLYLYCRQIGRDMYTGERININKLKKYTIDHIYPQSKLYDDSWDNLVLTRADINEEVKGDRYPIPYEQINNNSIKNKGFANNEERIAFFKFLKNNKFITEEKYNRLTRTGELSDEELFNFVNRQINYTSVVAKALKELFELKFKGKDVKIRFSKANIVSKFRSKNKIIKSREANNYHHAHDAFLNAIVGRTINDYFEKFYNYNNCKYEFGEKDTSNPIRLLEDTYKKYDDDKRKKYHYEYKKDITDRNGNVVYKRKETLSYIKNQIFSNFNILTSTRTYIKHDLFDQTTKLSKNEIKKGNYYLPLKSSKNFPLNTEDIENLKEKLYLKDVDLKNTEKYGGYSNLRYGYYSLIEVKKMKKGKVTYEYKLIPVPNLLENLPEEKERYIKQNYNLDRNQYEYIKDDKEEPIKLKVNTIVQVDKSSIIITGKHGSTTFKYNSAMEPNFDCKSIKIINKIKKLKDDFSKFETSISDGLKEKLKGKDENEKGRIKIDAYIDTNKTTINGDKITLSKKSFLEKEELDSLFDTIVEKIKQPEYKLNFDDKKIEEIKGFKEKCNNGSIVLYAFFILDMLNFCKMRTVNTKIIGGSKGTPKDFNSTIKPNTKIIYKSITGFYSKVIWELDKDGIPHNYYKEQV